MMAVEEFTQGEITRKMNNREKFDIVVIIPSYNEQSSVGTVVSESLEALEGLKVKVLVIDDGSSDQTADVAQRAGADVISHRRNRGVAQAVKSGVSHSLTYKPKIIVQLDADGQHDPMDIPKLMEPINRGVAELVIGRRKYGKWKNTQIKRFGNFLLTKLTNHLAGIRLEDTQSGFRAFSGDLAREINITSRNTYVQEMIIRAAREGFNVKEVDIEVRPRERGKSKVVSSIFSYAVGASITLIRVYRDYEPLRLFGGIGLGFLTLGMIIGLALLTGGSHISWLRNIFGFRSVFLFITVGVQIILFGFLADMLGNG